VYSKSFINLHVFNPYVLGNIVIVEESLGARGLGNAAIAVRVRYVEELQQLSRSLMVINFYY